MSVRIVIDFLHDVSLALWPGMVLAIWLLRPLILSAPGVPQLTYARVFSAIWVLVGCLIVLGITGALRLRYYELNLRTGTLAAKHKMVLIKHSAFGTLLIGCTIWFFYLLPPAG